MQECMGPERKSAIAVQLKHKNLQLFNNNASAENIRKESNPAYHDAGLSNSHADLMVPAARLEHATLCSASKCSNPLSYAGIFCSGILPHVLGSEEVVSANPLIFFSAMPAHRHKRFEVAPSFIL
jgi:hypothetical protein